MFARVALITTDWVAETTATYFLTALEARSMRSRGEQGWFLLRSVSMTCGWPSLCSHKLPLVHVYDSDTHYNVCFFHSSKQLLDTN